jgi:hypothetical protein
LKAKCENYPQEHAKQDKSAKILHVLSYLPGVKDGKLCVVMEDKEAAAKIGSLINRTNKQYRGDR